MNTYTMVFADLVTVILSIRYFNDQKDNKAALPLKKNPLTWIVLGIFINHSVNIPYTLALPYLYQAGQFNLLTSFVYVYSIINFAMLILFSKAYLCPTPQQN